MRCFSDFCRGGQFGLLFVQYRASIRNKDSIGDDSGAAIRFGFSPVSLFFGWPSGMVYLGLRKKSSRLLLSAIAAPFRGAVRIAATFAVSHRRIHSCLSRSAKWIVRR